MASWFDSRSGVSNIDNKTISSNSNKENISLDKVSEKVNNMQEKLKNSEIRLQSLTFKRKELERLLEKSTESVNHLKEEFSELQGKENEGKIRENTINEEIEKLVTMIENEIQENQKIKKNEEEEEENTDSSVSAFQKTCLNMTERLKLLLHSDENGNDGGYYLEEIKILEVGIQNSEKEIEETLHEKEKKALPISEMNILLKMANMDQGSNDKPDIKTFFNEKYKDNLEE